MESTTHKQANPIYIDPIASETFKQNLKTYLLNPLYSGLMGFAAFFSLILFTKLFSYLLGINDAFTLNLNDVIYSLTGFVFAAGAKFLEFFHSEE